MVFEPEVCTTELFLHLSCWALKPGTHSVFKLWSQFQHDASPYSSIFSSNRSLHSYHSSSARPFPPRSPSSLVSCLFPLSPHCLVLPFSVFCSFPHLLLTSLVSPHHHCSPISQKVPRTWVDRARVTRLTGNNQDWELPHTFPKSRSSASGTRSSHCPSSFSRWCLSRTEREDLGIWLSW